MGRAKIPRKSTWVDMTAFCDVAFLLLSFFILTTKFKTAEAIEVTTPNSVSSKAVEENGQVLFTVSPQGKVFLSLAEEDKRQDLVTDLNQRLGLQLTNAEINAAGKAEFFGTSLGQLKSYLNLPAEERVGSRLPGLIMKDTGNNEVSEWLSSAINIYQGSKMNLMVKGDENLSYPNFKLLIDTFKKLDQMKFQVVTSQEGIPEGSPLAQKLRSGQKISE